jgi:ADP-dependent phosphofructokinase/glucokinase
VLAKIPNSRQIAELYAKGKLIYPEIPEVKQQLERIKDFIKSKIPEGVKHK